MGTIAVLAALVGCDQRVDIGGLAQPVDVVYGVQSVEIDLGSLATVDVNDLDLVRLSDVVAAANLGVGLERLLVDFVAADGFQPRSSPNCTDEIVPLPGSYLEQGFIDPVTRDLWWDQALGLPGCVRVKDTAQILVSDAPAEE